MTVIVFGGQGRTFSLPDSGEKDTGGKFVDNTDEVVRMLDSLTEAGVSRIKVEISETIEEGTSEKAYHHGRCDVGSPFATGTLRNF